MLSIACSGAEFAIVFAGRRSFNTAWIQSVVRFLMWSTYTYYFMLSSFLPSTKDPTQKCTIRSPFGLESNQLRCFQVLWIAMTPIHRLFIRFLCNAIDECPPCQLCVGHSTFDIIDFPSIIPQRWSLGCLPKSGHGGVDHLGQRQCVFFLSSLYKLAPSASL